VTGVLKKLAAMRSYMRDINMGRAGDPSIPAAVDMTGAEMEAMFRLLTAIRQGEPFQEHDLLLLNDSAAVPPPLVSISAKDRTISRSGSVNSALSLMARECLELLGGPDLARLSWCADENCTRPFLDKSHGHRRRWCGMKGCGDRAKAAAYRRRVKTAGQGD